VLDQGVPQPLYRQLKQHILEQIRRGDLRPEQPIASERRLSEELNISRHTVRQALNELVLQGVLHRQPGRGTFVRLPGNALDRIAVSTSSSIVLDWSGQPTRWLGEPVLMDPGDGQFEQLALSAGEQVVYLEHVQISRGEPVNYWKSWIPASIGAPLLRRLPREGSILGVLFHECGMLVQSSRDRLEPSQASGAEAAVLELHAGDPVQLLTGCLLNDAGQAVEAHRSIIRASRFHLDIESRFSALDGG